MAVSEDFIQYILDQLDSLEDVRYKKMFGGVGIYSRDHFFALIENDTLRFKVDDSNRQDYEERQMEPFRPFPGKKQTMNYYQVPIEIVENKEELRDWAHKAIDVARQKKR